MLQNVPWTYPLHILPFPQKPFKLHFLPRMIFKVCPKDFPLWFTLFFLFFPWDHLGVLCSD